MQNKIPDSYYNIATKSSQILQRLNVDTKKLFKERDYSEEIGNIFMKDMFSKKRYHQFANSVRNREQWIKSSKYNENREITHKLVTENNLASILIRPEMMHIYESFIEFLKKEGFVTNDYLTFDVLMDSDKYWKVYKHAITTSQAKLSMPTRTMVYANSLTKLIIFTDNQKKRFKDEKLSDKFFETYKGKAGIYSPKTLRGDIVYKEAIKLGLNELKDPILALAFDPINMYRHLVSSNEGPHQILPDNKLMFYTSVSVHIPNSLEIENDLAVLLNKKQLLQIYNSLN
jgi:hypothetical protein